MKTGIKLLCPECLSDWIEPHITPKQKTEKFKCNRCGKVRLITKMQYAKICSNE